MTLKWLLNNFFVFAKQFAYAAYRNTQKNPEHTVKRADLSFKIQGAVTVIPNIELALYIYNKTAYALHKCNNRSADKALTAQAKFRELFIYSENSKETAPTRNRHSPVRFSPPQYFKQSISNSADWKQDTITF